MEPADPFWGRALLTVFFGAMAGGITNRVAIWMLFHPYHPPKLLGRSLTMFQGALPKNQARLAHTIGRTVGTRLITADDLAEELQDDALRAAFDDRIRATLTEVFESEHPPLGELLPEPAVAELSSLLDQVTEELGDQLVEVLDAPEFADRLQRLLASTASVLEGERLADTLDADTIRTLRDRAEEWLGELVESEEFARTVVRQVNSLAERLLRPGRTLEEVIPVRLVAAVEHAIQDYLPLVMERLGRLLEDPDARERVERLVHQLLDRFMSDLRFHQRVIAKLIITEETVYRVIDTLEAEGADRLSELLREREIQDAMARGVNDAIVDFLRRPVTAVLGETSDPQVESVREAVSEWIVQTAQDPDARRHLLDQAEETAFRFSDRSWADIVRLVPSERLGAWLAAGLRTEAGQQLLSTFRESSTRWLLSRRIGRPGRLLGENAAQRLTDALSPSIWSWITRQIPELTARVRIADRVEEKIRSYPLPQLEALVRSVTERELKLIVRLGYVLGAVIGTGLVVLTTLLQTLGGSG